LTIDISSTGGFARNGLCTVLSRSEETADRRAAEAWVRDFSHMYVCLYEDFYVPYRSAVYMQFTYSGVNVFILYQVG